MPGGKGNIKPSDGKQFSSDYQPQKKWTEEKALQLGNDLIQWLKEVDEDGNDTGNIFYEEFLIIKNDYYSELIAYLSNKFSSFLKLIKNAEKIQELKLQKYGVGDRLNASMTKFVLTNKHDWKTKEEIKNENINEYKHQDYSSLNDDELKAFIEINKKLNT